VAPFAGVKPVGPSDELGAQLSTKSCLPLGAKAADVCQVSCFLMRHILYPAVRLVRN
jgi:hypothetical protein